MARRSKQQTMSLSGTVDLTTVEALRDDLVEHLSGNGDLVFEAAKLDRIGTAAIQLILAAHHEALRQGRKVIFRDASEACRDAFRDVGLAVEFENWSGSA